MKSIEVVQLAVTKLLCSAFCVECRDYLQCNVSLLLCYFDPNISCASLAWCVTVCVASGDPPLPLPWDRHQGGQLKSQICYQNHQSVGKCFSKSCTWLSVLVLVCHPKKRVAGTGELCTYLEGNDDSFPCVWWHGQFFLWWFLTALVFIWVALSLFLWTVFCCLSILPGSLFTPV